MEEIDIAFNTWFNREQPMVAIVRVRSLSAVQLAVIKDQLKRAFVAGYVGGTAQHAARFDGDPDSVSPGLTE